MLLLLSYVSWILAVWSLSRIVYILYILIGFFQPRDNVNISRAKLEFIYVADGNPFDIIVLYIFWCAGSYFRSILDCRDSNKYELKTLKLRCTKIKGTNLKVCAFYFHYPNASINCYVIGM